MNSFRSMFGELLFVCLFCLFVAILLLLLLLLPAPPSPPSPSLTILFRPPPTPSLFLLLFRAIDDYEYVVALAGLAYMTDEHCQGPAYDSYNNAVYFGVQGQENGDIMMATYSDDKCLYPIDTDITYDDYFQGDGVDLGSKDQGQNDDTMQQIEEWWTDSQEYTMTLFNEVYDDYKYCTSCMDYPTYQDGYFIGDYGTDDDDLINQCWKFYSHDSFNCNGDCVAMAVFQGSALQVTMNGKTFGTSFDGQYDGQHSSSSSSANAQATRIERLKANLYLTMSGIVFVATFLAFAVARGSSKKKKASSRSRSRRLLDADYGGDSSRRRSSSRAKSSSRTSSRSASKTSRSSSSRSKSRSRRSEVGDYKSPSSASGDRARSKSRSRKSSSSSRK